MHSFGGVQIAFVVATMLFAFIKGAWECKRTALIVLFIDIHAYKK